MYELDLNFDYRGESYIIMITDVFFQPRHGTLLLMTGFLSAGIGLLFLGPAPFLPIPR